jgi:hypothetical protein
MKFGFFSSDFSDQGTIDDGKSKKLFEETQLLTAFN